MTAVNRASLYLYFQTGSKPTQSQFANLIDSCVNVIDTTAQSVASDLNIGGNSTIGGSLAVTGNTTLESAVVIGSATGGFKGSGTINAMALYVNGTLITTTSAGGSGTVSPGTANQLAYYQASTNTVIGTNDIPNGTTATTQAVADATTKLATTAFVNQTSSLAANGYIKMPNGLIIQWGTFIASSGGPAILTFPLPFPNSIWAFTGTQNQTASGTAFVSTSPPTLSNVSVGIINSSGSFFSATMTWIAIGN